jgi:hypothetical protein
VERAGTTERQQVCAWLGNTQSFAPELITRYAVIPPFTHEPEAVGRVGHDGVDAVIVHQSHGFTAVGVDEGRRPYFFEPHTTTPDISGCSMLIFQHTVGPEA